MKICVVSDLHCMFQVDSSTFSESFFISNMPRKPAARHPVAAMLNAINDDDSIKSRFLLCPGDLGHRADEQGIMAAWSAIDEISQKLESDLKIGIPGNHDINSRKLNGKDPFAYIHNFHEAFPTESDKLNDQFWNRGFCLLEHKEVLFLLVNTVHNHDSEENAAISDLGDVMPEEIKKELAAFDDSDTKYKICMLHHHPIKHSNIDNYKDGDSLEKGDKLLSLLTLNNFNLVVHGHKHLPRIMEQNGLTIFASGSFASFANLRGSGLNTMFHVIELFPDSKKGQVNSWEFDIKNGWKKKLNSEFPPKIGFGANLDIEKTAKIISKMVAGSKPPILYSTVLDKIPELAYLIPDKLLHLGEVLKKEYGLTSSPAFPLEPSIITTYA